jgi:hypothetical protein
MLTFKLDAPSLDSAISKAEKEYLFPSPSSFSSDDNHSYKEEEKEK